MNSFKGITTLLPTVLHGVAETAKTWLKEAARMRPSAQKSNRLDRSSLKI